MNSARKFAQELWISIGPFKPNVDWQDHAARVISERDAELKAQPAALLEKAIGICSYPSASGIIAAPQCAEAIRALIPADAATALADREAVIHHSYQCGEAYERLVSAQVDQIVAERVREAVQPFAEALEALVGKVAESSRRSQIMWLPDIGEVWKARDLLAAHRAAAGAQEKK